MTNVFFTYNYVTIVISIDYDPQFICKAIGKTKAKHSVGPDGISSFLLKKLSPSICHPLSILFRTTQTLCHIPAIWKESIVTAVHKKGSKAQPNNYRPISKESSFLKLKEKVEKDQITSYLEKFSLLSRFQYGFRAGTSVTEQLLFCLDFFSQNFHHGIFVQYIDFRKAFDTVSHSKLLTKLAAYGIGGELLAGLEDYLSGRSQRVQVGSSLSSPAPIKSGVLQGSCLGPLLFLLFINDLPQAVQSDKVQMVLFADDAKLFSLCPVALQEALVKLENWCSEWQLSLAVDKCNFMYISSLQVLPPYPFRLNGKVINYSSNQRDLGVLLNFNLDFALHYTSVVNKANSAAYNILKCFNSQRPKVMMRAFNVYVRPILETFSQVWNPHRKSDIRRLEAVQRRFTSNVYIKCGLPEASYQDRLKFFEQDTLEQRRKHLDLALAHKLFSTPSQLSQHLINRCQTLRPLRNPHHLVKETLPSRHPRNNFFSNRIIPSWNALPAKSIGLTTKGFKNFLKRHPVS